MRNKYRISIKQEYNNTGSCDISCGSVMTPRLHLLLWCSLNRCAGSGVCGLICGEFFLFYTSCRASAFSLTAMNETFSFHAGPDMLPPRCSSEEKTEAPTLIITTLMDGSWRRQLWSVLLIFFQTSNVQTCCFPEASATREALNVRIVVILRWQMKVNKLK